MSPPCQPFGPRLAAAMSSDRAKRGRSRRCRPRRTHVPAPCAVVRGGTSLGGKAPPPAKFQTPASMSDAPADPHDGGTDTSPLSVPGSSSDRRPRRRPPTRHPTAQRHRIRWQDRHLTTVMWRLVDGLEPAAGPRPGPDGLRPHRLRAQAVPGRLRRQGDDGDAQVGEGVPLTRLSGSRKDRGAGTLVLFTADRHDPYRTDTGLAQGVNDYRAHSRAIVPIVRPAAPRLPTEPPSAHPDRGEARLSPAACGPRQAQFAPRQHDPAKRDGRADLDGRDCVRRAGMAAVVRPDPLPPASRQGTRRQNVRATPHSLTRSGTRTLPYGSDARRTASTVGARASAIRP